MSKTKSTKTKFDIHYVKRDPSTLSYISKKGEDENGQEIEIPVLGEKIKSISMQQQTASELNVHWPNTGKYVVASKAEKVKQEVPAAPQSEDLQSEFPDVYKMTKDILINNLESFGLEVQGTVPVLKQRLAQHLADNK